jgi:hypothetical protein
MGLGGFISRLRHPPALALPMDEVAAILQRHGTQPWFAYANRDWSRRKHVRIPCTWLATRLAPDARIVETGCGCGLNLLWLARRGFRELSGIDVDAPALAAGAELARRSGVAPRFIQGDASRPPAGFPGGIAALLALNWTYHVTAFDLGGFFAAWRPLLAPGALVAMDFIDGSAAIAGLPPEYHHTTAPDALARAAGEHGLEVVRSERFVEGWPRLVALLQVAPTTR